MIKKKKLFEFKGCVRCRYFFKKKTKKYNFFVLNLYFDNKIYIQFYKINLNFSNNSNYVNNYFASKINS